MVNDYANRYIQENCNYFEGFKRNIMLLDTYDFSEFLTDGRSLWNIKEAIEDKYDKEFFEKYQIYVFDELSGEDTCMYFASRYNVWFDEYTDWVVRHDNGAYERTRKRIADN